MTGRGARDPSGEAGPGATHRRPVPPPDVGDTDERGEDDDREPDAPVPPRGTGDERPIDVAPATGPFEMDAPEAGMEDE